MRTKVLVIAAILAMVLAGCDRIVHLPDERFLPMVNEVGAAYDATFEADMLGAPEGAILIIFSPETSRAEAIPYTEARVDDFTKLNEVYGGYSDLLLFSTKSKETTVLFYFGSENDKDSVFFKVDGKTLLLKQYDIMVPLGNTVRRNVETNSLRQIILVPRWYTFGAGFSFTTDDTDRINELEKGISDNFIVIMEEVSKHIDFHSEGSPGE